MIIMYIYIYMWTYIYIYGHIILIYIYMDILYIYDIMIHSAHCVPKIQNHPTALDLGQATLEMADQCLKRAGGISPNTGKNRNIQKP